MMVPRSLLCVALGLALSCTTSQPPSAGAGPTPSPAPGPAATLEPSATGYDVHEWGLVDYALVNHAYEVATGPGLHRWPLNPAIPPPTPTVPPTPLGTAHGTSAPRKPVVYFHLREGSSPVTVAASARIAFGRILEHWPNGEPDGDAIRWPNVVVTAEHCTGLTYPSREDARCLGVTDAYCELAEAAAYETPDASCLTLGGTRYNHLFYRGGGTGRELPLRVTRNFDGSLDVVNASIAGPVPIMARLVRPDASTTHAWVGEVPAMGARVLVPVPSDGAALPAARRGVANALRGLGLTADESDAFARAWSGELFDNATPNGAPYLRDVLLFFLPPAMASEWAELSFTPAPTSLVRVFAVRVDVGP